MSDFTYLHSEAIDRDIKVNRSTGEVIVKERHRFNPDKLVTYSRKEVDILKEIGGISPKIHRVKNIFEGEIIAGGKL